MSFVTVGDEGGEGEVAGVEGGEAMGLAGGTAAVVEERVTLLGWQVGTAMAVGGKTTLQG